MIGAYQDVPAFAYPGWRLTVPGGPAGGHYKGFTHTQSAGTDIPPQDQYEQDREDGMSSHDAVHASPRNPRGVYRSSGEVPPRPNASGMAHSYRSFQTQRHPGQAVAPGSFPADFAESDEDAFLSRFAELHGLGFSRAAIDGEQFISPLRSDMIVRGPNVVWSGPPSVGPIIRGPIDYPMPGPAQTWIPPLPPTSGATSVVNQPVATPAPLPPSPSVPVYVAPPVSPAPAPTVATNQVVPLNDGSGNYLNLSNGTIIPASAVVANPATGQLTAPPATAGVASSALSWLEQNTIFSAVPNWTILAGGAALAMMLMGGKHGR